MGQWVPIIPEGSALADRAWNAVYTIADAIFNQNNQATHDPQRPHRPHEDPLLYAYLALASDDDVWLDRAIEKLNIAISGAPNMNYFGLYGGICGLGWVVEHFTGKVTEADNLRVGDDDDLSQDLNHETDIGLLQHLRKRPWLGHYDLISGLVGFGTYFLERLPRPTAVEGLMLIADHLTASAEHTDNAITWHSGPELLPDWQRKLNPGGYYNLGVSHGIPGVIWLLNEMKRRRLDHKRTHSLLEGSVEWLLAHRRPPGSLSYFSAWISPEESSDSRLAWCYGDLGIVAVLMQVAADSAREDWKGFASEMLDHCLRWPEQASGVQDTPLCHGASGIAHVFNRIYQGSGDERAREAAIRWFERTLAMQQPGLGFGGFPAVARSDPRGEPTWQSSAAFLDGANGVGLALLGALTSIDPEWDRLLLLSSRS